MVTIRKVFPILALSIFSSMLGVGIIAPLLPLYAENLGATGIWLGIIFAGFSVTRAIFMPIVGRLSDRRGRKLFLCIGLIIYAIMSLGYVWANSVLQLTLIRLLHGIAAGMVFPVTQAYIGDMAPEGEEGTWMGYFNAAFFTGFGFGPLMGGVLTDHFGMSAAFFAMGSLNFLAFLLVIIFLPEVRRVKTATTPNLSFRKMGTSVVVKGLFIYRLAEGLGRGSLITFLPVFSGIYLGLSLTLIGILLTTNVLLTSVLLIPLGKIADRFNRRVMVILGSFITFAYLALIPLTGNFWQLLGLCALGGFGVAISMPSASALTVEEGRKYGMASTMSVLAMSMSIGMVVGPILSGVLADFVNIGSVFYFSAGTVFLGSCLFIWFTKKEKIILNS